MELGGVDEAGRGPVLGPMVVVGVSIRMKNEMVLRKLVPLDSKRLKPHIRDKISVFSRPFLEVVAVSIIKPEEIDKWVLRRGPGGLNRLEAKAMALIVRMLDVDTIYVDACDVNSGRFGDMIRSRLGGGVNIICEHKADEKYSVVKAASIIAKVIRDREVIKFSKTYGEVGSGYASDRRTIRFIEGWLRDKGEVPPQVRRSWRTITRLLEKRDVANNYR